MSAETDLDQIRDIVEHTDEHRNRERREAWSQIKSVLAGETPNLDEVRAVEADAGEAPSAPPKHGSGSSARAWHEYAALIGVDVPAEATKAQVIEAVEAAAELDNEG